MPTKYEGIILNSTLGETEKIYKSLGFNKYLEKMKFPL